MRASQQARILRGLREQAQWKLLASENAPIVIALLRELLFDRDSLLSSRIFLERLGSALDELRGSGIAMERRAAAYAAEWVRLGYLSRRLPARGEGADEIYELTPEAAAAIRFVGILERPRAFATESRLASVIAQMVRLAEETNPNPQSRIDMLTAERARIEKEIEVLEAGQVEVLSPDRALELAREILGQAEALIGDFRRVRDDFETLSRKIRESLLDDSGNRGEVLESFFSGMDLIDESAGGKAFVGLWKLLNDAEQFDAFDEAIEAVSQQAFVRELDADDQRGLKYLLDDLLQEARKSNEVMLSLSRGLKTFVQSREYLEQRRLNELLKAANAAAMAARDAPGVKPWTPIPRYSFTRTSSQVRSVTEWGLLDPELRLASAEMPLAEDAVVDPAAVALALRLADIDMTLLKNHVQRVLADTPTVTVGGVLERFPASQGLGSVAGLLSLASKYGYVAEGTETVSWETKGVARRARIPVMFFVREKMNA